MTDLTQKLMERMQSVAIPAPVPRLEKPQDDARWSFRMAAAVLHSFQPDSLRPLDSSFADLKCWRVFQEDMVPVAGGFSEGLFTLSLISRREALRRLGTRKAMQLALQANPHRVQTPLQLLFEEYVASETVPPADSMSYAELTRLASLVDWLGDLDPTLPDAASLQILLRQKSVLANFEHLVIENFVGRETEMALIRQHIGALPPTADDTIGRQQLQQWAALERTSILVIYGPGGIGKSALVGRLLWEHTQTRDWNRIPFAYLAFDQTSLLIESPYTLLLEMADQFDRQLPYIAKAAARFKERVSHYQQQRTALAERQKFQETREARLSNVQDLDNQLIESFVELLLHVTNRHSLNHVKYKISALLVLDTFEEVQYRDRESLTGFWRMLDFLQSKATTMRIIICGRAPIGDTGFGNGMLREMPLTQLEPPDRVHLLTRLGVSNTMVAEAVARQVGGNPLSLRLAADVIRKDKDAADESGIKGLLFRVDEQLIQGQLYTRILEHIHNEKVQQLAHPGMILRRVNPDIILNLLAPACRIEVESMDEAEQLFAELRREHGLVVMGEANTLMYRPEIRQAMIRLLKQDKFSIVRRLHQEAIYYYMSKKKAELTERAEEMYHRLALGEDSRWTLDQRWMKGIEKSVAANQEEYSDEMLAWLASRMNLEVSRSVYQSANISEWERNITRKVRYALSELQTTQALTLLSERPERLADSPLYALEAKVYMLQKKLTRAWYVLEDGIQRVLESSNRGRLAELFWLQAQVALLRNEPEQADALLVKAEKAVEKAEDPTPLLHILCHRWMLRQYSLSASPPSKQELESRIDKVISACSLEQQLGGLDSFVVALCWTIVIRNYGKRKLPDWAGTAVNISEEMLTSENLRGLDLYRKPWEIDDQDSNYISEESIA